MPRELFTLWIFLMENCKDLSPKEFNNKQKQIANMYKKMSISEQGEFHLLVSQDHRRWSENRNI